jgi:hypothetical protein
MVWANARAEYEDAERVLDNVLMLSLIIP